MAAIKASVNLFALLDGNDPGDKRLVDFDSQLKEQAGQPKKKPAPAAAPGYNKPKKNQASGPDKKKPASAAAASTKKPASTAASARKPTSRAASGFKSEKNSPAPMAMAMNKQTTPAPPAPAPQAPSTNLTRLLFAYPSARERIFKQRQEEFERRQAKAAENAAAAFPDSSDEGKNAAAGAAPGEKKKNGKTHGVKLQRGGGGRYYNGVKEQPGVPVKEATSPPASFTAPPAVEEPAMAPVVKTAPMPLPPSIDDIDQFPSLK